MLRKIKSDCIAEGFDESTGIVGFLSESQDDCFCAEILGLPGFDVYVWALPEQHVILIGDNSEVQENIISEI